MNWVVFAQLLGMGGGGGAPAAVESAVGYRAIPVVAASLDYRADGDPLLDFRSIALQQPDFKAIGVKSADYRADGNDLDYRAIER